MAKIDGKQLFWATGIDNKQLSIDKTEAVNIFKKLSTEVKNELDAITKSYKSLQNMTKERLSLGVNANEIKLVESQMKQLDMLITKQITSMQKMGISYESAMQKIKTASSQVGKGVKADPLKQTVQNIHTSVARAESDLSYMEKIFKRAGAYLVAYGAFSWTQQLVSDLITVKGQFDQLRVAMDSFIGDARKSGEVFNKLTDLAVKSPFQLLDITDSAKQLLAYGVAADDVTRRIRQISDVSAGSGQAIKDIAYLYGTSLTQGRLYARDLFQFANRGIPIYKELAAVMNVSTERLMNMVKAGQVGFPELEKAFNHMTDAGGKYAGLSDKLAETTYGKISNLKDKWTIALNDMGTEADGIVSMGVEGITALISNWREVAKAIEAVVIAYGSYKAATAIGGLVTATTTYASNYAEAKSLEALISVEVKETLAKQGMVIGSAEYVAALRAEMAAQISASSSIVLATTTEIATIRALVTAKEAALLEDRKLLAQKKIAFGLIMAEGDANAISAAKIELNTIQKRINTNAAEKNILLNKASVAVRERDIAVTATQTATTGVNTAATVGNAASKNILTAASARLTAAVTALNAAVMANPYTAAIVLIVGIATAMWYFYDGTTAAEKALKSFNDEQDKFKKKQEETREAIDKNISIMQDEAETTAAKEFAYKRLTELSPSLTAAYSREAIETMNLAQANKILNEERDRESYDDIIKKVNDLTDSLKKLNEQQSVASDTNYEFIGQRSVAEVKIEQQQELLQLYKTKQAEWDKAIQESKPLDIKIGDAKSDLFKISQEFNDAKKLLDAERDKLAKNKFYVIPFEIELRYTKAEKAKINQEGLLKNLMGGVDVGVEKNKAYYEKLKNEAEEKLASMSNTMKGSAAWVEAKNLIQKYTNILKDWDTGKDTSDKDSRNKEAKLRREEDFAKEILQIKTDTETSLNEIAEKSYAKDMQALTNANTKKLDKIKTDAIELNKKARAIGVDFDANGNVKIKGTKATEQEKYTMEALINLNRQKENEEANFLTRKVNLEREAQEKIDKVNYDTFKSFSSDLDKKIYEISEKYRKMYIDIRENAKPNDIESMNYALGMAEDTEIEEAYLEKRKAMIEYQADIATQRNNASQIDNTLLKSKAQMEIDIEIEKNKQLLEENQAYLDMINAKKESVTNDPKLNSTEKSTMLSGLDAQSVTYSDIIRKLKIVSALEEERSKKQKNDDLVKNLNDAGSALGKLGELASQFDADLGKTLSTAGSLATGIGGLVSSIGSGNILGAVGSAAGVLTTVISLFDDSEAKAKRAAELKRQEKGYWDAINNSIQTQKDLIDSLATSLMGAFSGTTLAQYQYKLDKIKDKLTEIKKGNYVGGLGEIKWKDSQPLTELEKEASRAFINAFENAYKIPVVGASISNASDIFNKMTDEQIVSLRGVSAIWSKLTEDQQEYINQLAETKKSQDEFMESLKKSVTGFDFSIVSDGLINALNSSEDSAEVWADNMKDIIKGVLQQAIVSQFLKKQIEDQINTYYTGLTKASTDFGVSGDKKALADAQAIASKEFVSGMNTTLTTAQDIWKNAQESLSKEGLDFTSTSSNNSTSSAIKNITSDQADLLSAQAISMRINISDIRTDVGKILLYLQNNGGNNDIMSMALAHQSNILELASKDIQEIAINTRDLASIKKSLNNMVEYGIKVK